MFAAEDSITISSTYLLAIFLGSGGVIATLFHLLITSKDREFSLVKAQLEEQIKEIESMKKVYQEVATEAVKSAAEMANFLRSKEGKPPVSLPAPVISEGHSPPNEKQRETARMATLRASLAAIKESVGQEPRKEPGHD